MASQVASVTVYSVAERAGVSHTTVSRVLNGRPNIAETTRRKVMAAAEAMGYQPNRSARALVTRKPADAALTVEVVMCHLSPNHEQLPGGYYMQLVRGCDQSARVDGNVEWHLGYWNRQEDGRDLESRLSGQGIAGVILIGAVHEPMVRRLRERGLSVVLASEELPGSNLDAVTLDNFSGGMLAARHLLQHGYRRIGWLGGDRDVTDWSERLYGVRAAMSEVGLLFREGDCRNGTQSIEGCERVIREWVESGDLPEAVILPCAMQASVVQRVMLEKQLYSPRDMGMICFDDDVFVSMCVTEPTRIDTRPQLVGQKAMERLIYLLRHPEANSTPHKTVVQAKLIDGKTVAQVGEVTP